LHPCTQKRHSGSLRFIKPTMMSSFRATDVPSPSRVPLPIKEVLELYGELGIAAWNGGKPVRSWVAFCTIVSELVRAWDPEAPGYREVFRKTGHILNRFASISMRGKPPAKTSNGSEYQAPAPGMFDGRNSRLSEVSTPMHRHVMVHLLGQMAIGINRRRPLGGNSHWRPNWSRARACCG
jgi:hypothetical protein